MPTSWWGKALIWLYVIGMWVRIAAIGFVTWPQFSFTDWQAYMWWQFIYGFFWPITLVVGLVSGFASGFLGG